jgi:hypothetical protein
VPFRSFEPIAPSVVGAPSEQEVRARAVPHSGPDGTDSTAVDPIQDASAAPIPPDPIEVEPLLCRHCGRTASNGISCEGACVADSGY